jgi:hypothetical protein
MGAASGFLKLFKRLNTFLEALEKPVVALNAKRILGNCKNSAFDKS